MKRKSGIVTAAVLAVSILGLAACGGSDKTDANSKEALKKSIASGESTASPSKESEYAGDWVVYEIRTKDESNDDVFVGVAQDPDGLDYHIRFLADGTGENYTSLDQDIKWSDGKIYSNMDGEYLYSADYWLEDGYLVVDDDTYLVYYQKVENYDDFFAALYDQDGGVIDTESWWSGDWYGWWTINSGKGDWAGLDGAHMDACAHIDAVPGGMLSVTLWDEISTEEVPLAEITLEFMEDTTGEFEGVAVSKSGYFSDMSVAATDFVADPAHHGVEDMIVMDGIMKDGDTELDVSLYLRPWGTDWSDLSDNDNALPYSYEDMLPEFYDSWYVPLVNAGEDMPTKMEVE